MPPFIPSIEVFISTVVPVYEDPPENTLEFFQDWMLHTVLRTAGGPGGRGGDSRSEAASARNRLAVQVCQPFNPCGSYV